MRRLIVILWLGLSASWAGAADDLAGRVIILANSRQSESVRLAEFYADARGIPRGNIIGLPMAGEETLTWRQFIDQIYQPLQDELYARGRLEGTSSSLVDSIGRKRYSFTSHDLSYLVVCRGVPLRIMNDPTQTDQKPQSGPKSPFATNEGAVDAELSLLAKSGYETASFVPNPLFNSRRPATFDAQMIVKVSRLDGPSWKSARQLVTSALTAEKQGLIGRYYVDLKGPHKDGDTWLAEAGKVIERLGYDGVVDEKRATFGDDARFDAPAFYFGWYASHANGPFKQPDFQFPPGAIALHIHSYSATTLRSETSGWTGPLIARGVTATVGNVFEPYLQLTHRPDVLMKALAEGKTLGDAFYHALPALSWKCIAIGDPLYRPFKVSLEEQSTSEATLPPGMSSYVTLRRAQLLEQESGPQAALALLKTAAKTHPDIVLSVAIAQNLIAAKKPKEAIHELAYVTLLPSIRPKDWGIIREVAELQSKHGAKPAALKLYEKLARTTPPSTEALKSMLTKARSDADAAGDLERSLEFARQLNAFTEAAPTKTK
jgi:uncharacterized protein (TIGR03790 family)